MKAEKEANALYDTETFNKIVDECVLLSANARKKMVSLAEWVEEDIHWGGALSSVEILVTLYHAVLNVKKESEFKIRDKFLLSKGHAAVALYTVMNLEGMISDALYRTYRQDGAPLPELLHYDKELGFEVSGGSLGLGLSYGVGLALLAKKKGYTYHTYVEVGDGELDEGNIWEAAMSASQFGLDNLTVIVDANVLQLDGYTKDIMDLGNIGDKFSSFGFEVYETDGHDCRDLLDAFKRKSESNKPKGIIAHTVKGKGISFMEGNYLWHDRRLQGKELMAAKEELRTDA